MTWDQLAARILQMSPAERESEVLYRPRSQHHHDAPTNRRVNVRVAERNLESGDETADDWPEPMIRKGAMYLFETRA